MAELIPPIPPGYGALGLLAMLILAWWKMEAALKKIHSDDSISLRSDLLGRVKELETALLGEQSKCDAEKLHMQNNHDAKIEALNQQHHKVIADKDARIDMLMDALMASNVAANKEHK